MGRISVDQALDHPYFQAFGARTDPEVKAARAVSPVDWSFDRDLYFDASGQSKPFNEQTFRAEFHDAARLVLEGEGWVTPIPAVAVDSCTRRAEPGNNVPAEGAAAAPGPEGEAGYETQLQPRPVATPRDGATDVASICDGVIAEGLASEQVCAAERCRIRDADVSARQPRRSGSKPSP